MNKARQPTKCVIFIKGPSEAVNPIIFAQSAAIIIISYELYVNQFAMLT